MGSIVENPYADGHNKESLCEWGIVKTPYVEGHNEEYYIISISLCASILYVGGIAKNPYVDGHSKGSLCGWV